MTNKENLPVEKNIYRYSTEVTVTKKGNTGDRLKLHATMCQKTV